MIKKKTHIIRLAGLIALCYLQSLSPLKGLPLFLDIALWSIYMAQLFVLSCRVFGIRVKTILKVILFFRRNGNE